MKEWREKVTSKSETLNRIEKVLTKLGINYIIVRHTGYELPFALFLLKRNNAFRIAFLDIRGDWNDSPGNYQIWYVEDLLRQFGAGTGYVVGDELKENWYEKTPISFSVWVQDIMRRRQ